MAPRRVWIALLLASCVGSFAGCANPPAAPAAVPSGAPAPVAASIDAVPPLRLTLLAAEPSVAPPIAPPPPIAIGDLVAAPLPTAELDHAAFRGQVVWITFYSALC